MGARKHLISKREKMGGVKNRKRCLHSNRLGRGSWAQSWWFRKVTPITERERERERRYNKRFLKTHQRPYLFQSYRLWKLHKLWIAHVTVQDPQYQIFTLSFFSFFFFFLASNPKPGIAILGLLLVLIT